MTTARYLTQTALIERGWTRTLIGKYLPNPTLKPNPRYRSAAPMRLWAESDVLSAESLPEWAADKARSERRKAGATKAVATKTRATLDRIAEFAASVEVERVDAATLEWLVRSDRLQKDLTGYGDGYDSAPDATRDRWAVNLIRHRLTSYDEGLYNLIGQVGRDAAYVALKNEVLRKIADVYPWLSDECNRQRIHTNDV